MVKQNFIDGEWVAPFGGEYFERLTPYDQTLVDVYADSDERDVHLAIGAAREAFDSGTWPQMPARERATILHKAASLIRERVAEFEEVMAKEIGQIGQRGAALAEADQLDYYASLIVSSREDAVYSQHPDSLGVVAKEPVGVVGVLTAWNAPLSIGHKACPALAAGCTLVVKPAHQAPGATILLARILAEAGVPGGAFNVITSARSNGAVAGQAIAGDARIDAVTFTGSSQTGRAVMTAAAANLTQVHLELGGKSPNVIFADAPSLDLAALSAAKQVVRLSGQSCQTGSRLLVQDSVKERVLDLVLAEVAKAKLGSPFTQGTTCGPLISEEQIERVEEYVALGAEEGKLVAGGTRAKVDGLGAGFFYEPTVFDEVPPDARIAQEEIFGPVLSVMSFGDLDEAVEIANSTDFGLASGCWTTDIDKAFGFARRVRSGVVWVNSFRDDVLLKHMPLGGYKSSGIGREWGPEGLDAFRETKSIMVRFGRDTPR